MKHKEGPRIGEYVDVAYYQYNQGPLFKSLWKTLTLLCVPFLLPLIFTTKASDFIFKGCSEFLSLVPSPFGFIMRCAFYKFTLGSRGENALIDFGTVFYYP